MKQGDVGSLGARVSHCGDEQRLEDGASGL